MKETTSKPCGQCPFRRSSMRGYLGPWENPTDILHQGMSEQGLACHMTVTSTGNWEGAKVCAGSLVCSNKSAKAYRNPELARLQTQLEGKPFPEVMDAREFLKYHASRR